MIAARYRLERRFRNSPTWREFDRAHTFAGAQQHCQQWKDDYEPGQRDGRYYDYRVIDNRSDGAVVYELAGHE